MRAETAERIRRFGLFAKRTESDGEAIGNASGITSDSGSLTKYLGEMGKEFSRQMDWMKRTGESAPRTRRCPRSSARPADSGATSFSSERRTTGFVLRRSSKVGVKLPEIDYTTPVQESSGSYCSTERSAEAGGERLRAGLDAFGTELVKSQHNRAAADLLPAWRLRTIDLRTQKTISNVASCARRSAGLTTPFRRRSRRRRRRASSTRKRGLRRQGARRHPHVRGRRPRSSMRAKKLLADSVSKFSSAGWAAEFQDEAQHEIVQQKKMLSLHTM
jgi:hypothetical protein